MELEEIFEQTAKLIIATGVNLVFEEIRNTEKENTKGERD